MIALIADIHGNTWALDAVLSDLRQRGTQMIVNLGDHLYGSLDPAGTFDRLRSLSAVSIRGNQDWIIPDPPPGVAGSPDHRYVTNELARFGPAALDWLRAQPLTAHVEGVLCCHGTPTSDTTYLLEEVRPEGVFLRDEAGIAALLGDTPERVIACGHTHVPRVVTLADGRLIVNPGSVGIPAYTDDLPYPHCMETGSPHARYALLHSTPDGWHVELVAVPYAWAAAAAAAQAHGRPDRARWISTGRV